MLTTPPLSLYVHFPWCVRKCPYCDFNSYTLHGELEEERYVTALERDLETQAAAYEGDPEPQTTAYEGDLQAAAIASRPVTSIFLGGGTPSLFSPRAIARVLDAARGYLTVGADVEVTMEANPGAVEHGRFAEYRAAGLTRVSLGAQSFDATSLRALGRIHSPEETRRAAEELHKAQLGNFNLDLMYALPGQSVRGAIDDIEAALALGPAHVSHYQLTIEPGTTFAARSPALPHDDVATEMLDACTERLEAAGFARYEVSAYAKPQRQCRHNLNYWSFGDYLGVGAGAHGKVSLPRSASVVRTQHVREPRRYLAHRPAVCARRTVAPEDLSFEFMLNALRLVAGFERSLFESRTGLAWDQVAGVLQDLAARGLLEQDGSRWRPSAFGLRFLNDALLSFLPETPQTTGGFGLSTVV